MLAHRALIFTDLLGTFRWSVNLHFWSNRSSPLFRTVRQPTASGGPRRRSSKKAQKIPRRGFATRVVRLLVALRGISALQSSASGGTRRLRIDSRYSTPSFRLSVTGRVRISRTVRLLFLFVPISRASCSHPRSLPLSRAVFRLCITSRTS